MTGTATQEPTLRLDKWLWHARFLKTRTLATRLCEGGKVRLNGERVAKSHQPVRAGDVLTFPLGRRIRVVRVMALGERRGPAPEAQALYEDMSPPPPSRDERAEDAAPPGAREAGSGRPTKADRRAVDRFTGR